MYPYVPHLKVKRTLRRMDLQVLTSLLLLSFSFLLLLAQALKRRSSRLSKSRSQSQKQLPLPPSPWRLPVIGHIHHLAGKMAHRVLRDLALAYGSVILLNIGHVDVVVVSSREAAEEVMRTHDINCANRPEIAVAKIVGYDCSDVAFSSYGGYWRQLKKICTVEMFSARRVKSFASVREEETAQLMRAISEAPPATPVNLSERLMEMVSHITCRASVGKKYENPEEGFVPIVKETMAALSGFSITDSYPSLKFLDALTGTTLRYMRIRRRMDKLFDELIKQHQAKKEEDLMGVLLGVRDENENLEIPVTFDSVKAVMADIFVGGTDTTATALEWAMSELMRNPEVMKKAQAEVREAMRGKTELKDADAGELNYLKLVVKETLRLHPPLPLLLPRMAKESCEVAGFRVPGGSRVLINAWALGRDPAYWGEDAEGFRPERFEGSAVDLKGANFEFVPFGAGRRMCPGIQFALANVELALARLLFYFDWELPAGVRPEELDMEEQAGSTSSRKTGLCVLATPRIPLPGGAAM